MDNKQQYNQASNTEERYGIAAPKKLRVERVHGGENVEEVITPELMNDTACKHDEWILDPTETEFTAYMCANTKCGIVQLYQ